MPCQTVQIQDVPDESILVIGDISTTSPAPGEVVVEYLAANQITSGDGQSLTGDVTIEVNGGPVEQQQVTISPSGSAQGSATITGLPPGGSVEICVTIGRA